MRGGMTMPKKKMMGGGMVGSKKAMKMMRGGSVKGKKKK